METKKVILISFFLILFATLVSAAPDLNIVSPQSGESYSRGTTITIDFNVSDVDNNRLTLDINYSSVATKGTGTVVENDLNLTDAYCVEQDWTGGTTAECTYSWVTTTVPAGCYTVSGAGNLATTACNYYILLDANGYVFPAEEGTDFNAGSSYITITTVSEVNVDLTNIGTLINNSTTLGDFVMSGVKDQGELMGLAIGLVIAITLLIALIFSIIAVIPRLIKRVKQIR